MNARDYDHLEKVKADVREEIKRRIDQRDKYSIQLTVVLSAILAAAFSGRGFERVLLAAPLASIYFTVLILYSYRIHRLLAQYLREEIDPRLAEIAGVDPRIEWEAYYERHNVPGIRKTFFLTALWIVTVGSLALLFAHATDDPKFLPVLVVVTFLYVGACLVISATLGKAGA